MDNNLALKLLAAVDKFIVSPDKRVHIDNPAWSGVIDTSHALRVSCTVLEVKEWLRLTRWPGGGIG